MSRVGDSSPGRSLRAEATSRADAARRGIRRRKAVRMPAPLPPPVWPFGLLLARDARAEGWGGRLHSAARRRELVKVRPGVYIASERWSAMSPEDRYRARIRAAALVCESIVFSHQSAAVVHGLPVLRSRLVRLHTLQLTPAGSGSRGDITVHAFSGDPDIVVRDGVRVTSPARTVLDLARTLPHGEALAAADAAIRPASSLGSAHRAGAPMCSLSELVDRAHAVADARGGRAVALVVHEADPRSGSLGGAGEAAPDGRHPPESTSARELGSSASSRLRTAADMTQMGRVPDEGVRGYLYIYGRAYAMRRDAASRGIPSHIGSRSRRVPEPDSSVRDGPGSGERLDRRARAHQVAVAVRLIDATHRRPVLRADERVHRVHGGLA